MPDLAAISQRPTAKVTPYPTNWAHLADELKRLDLRLRLLLLRNPGSEQYQPSNLLEQLRGLVLTDGEITRLLENSDNDAGDDGLRPDPMQNEALIQACDELDEHIRARVAATQSTFLPLSCLARLFNLTPFEEQCLVICLAPELDRKYEKLYAYAQDDVTRKKPSTALVLDLLCPKKPENLSARVVFDPHAPLVRYRLVQISDNADSPSPLLSRSLKLDDRITNFLLGHPQPDSRLEPFARLVYPPAPVNSASIGPELEMKTRAFLRRHFDGRE